MRPAAVQFGNATGDGVIVTPGGLPIVGFISGCVGNVPGGPNVLRMFVSKMGHCGGCCGGLFNVVVTAMFVGFDGTPTQTVT